MRTLGNFGKFRHIYVQICSADINIANVFFATKPFHFYSLHIITWQRQSQSFCDKIQASKCLLAKLESKSSVVSLLHQRPSDLLHALDSLSQVIVHQTPSDIPNIKWVGATGGGFVHTLIRDGDFHQTRVSTQRNPAVLIRRILPAVQLIPLI